MCIFLAECSSFLDAVVWSTDCEDSCSYNPVILYPTEIIEEYGREVFINCSSDYLHFTIIKINVKNESRYPDLYRDYVDSLYTLDDWDIEATCIVHVNETHKCYKDVDITVYSKCAESNKYE